MTLRGSTRLSPGLWARRYRADDGEQQPISVVEREFGLETQRKRHGLDLMRPVVEALGNPHLRYPVIHITGSKGKGSTAAIAASLLKAAGYRVGLYTSPSLTSFNERIQVDAVPVTDEELDRHVRELLQTLDRHGLPRPRFFEAATAVAFVHFARQEVDVAVVEVGVGGRRDATNVVRPAVSVITTVELEHTAILGDSLEHIAAEKAGIVKAPAPVVTGVTADPAREVVLQRAGEQRVKCYELGRHFDAIVRAPGRTEQRFDFVCSADGSFESYRDLRLPLAGTFQCRNAALAIAAVRAVPAFASQLNEAAIRRGLAAARWPGRLELRRRGETDMLLDVAHTPESVSALCEYVGEHFAEKRPHVLILGILRDKALDQIAQILAPEFDLVIAAPVKWYRSAEPEAVQAECLAAGIPCRIAGSIREAVLQGFAEASGGLLVIAGSVFAVGEAKRAFGWTEDTTAAQP